MMTMKKKERILSKLELSTLRFERKLIYFNQGKVKYNELLLQNMEWKSERFA